MNLANFLPKKVDLAELENVQEEMKEKRIFESQPALKKLLVFRQAENQLVEAIEQAICQAIRQERDTSGFKVKNLY
jgi:hypothetical protein